MASDPSSSLEVGNRMSRASRSMIRGLMRRAGYPPPGRRSSPAPRLCARCTTRSESSARTIVDVALGAVLAAAGAAGLAAAAGAGAVGVDRAGDAAAEGPPQGGAAVAGQAQVGDAGR